MALTTEDKKEMIALIQEAFAPQFKNIDKRFENIDKRFENIAKLIQNNTKAIEANRIEAKENLEKLKAKFIKR